MGGVFAVAASPDWSFIVTGSVDEAVRMWNAHNGVRAILLLPRGGASRQAGGPYPPSVMSADTSPRHGLPSVWCPKMGGNICPMLI